MVYIEKIGKDIDNEKLKNNLIWSERFRRLRQKIFSIQFLTMLGIWIIVYYQFTSHFHHPDVGDWERCRANRQLSMKIADGAWVLLLRR